MSTVITEIPAIEDCRKLIYHLAYKYYKYLSNDCTYLVEDFVQEGNLCYLEDQHKFDSSRSSFYTFFYHQLQYRFYILLQKADKHNMVSKDGDEEFLKYGGYESHKTIQDSNTDPDILFYKKLTKDAEKFVKQFFDPSYQYQTWEEKQPIDHINTRKYYKRRQRICRYYKWTPAKEKRIVRELQMKLSRGIL